MLMKFGTDMADNMGFPCFLEGSLEGLGLYHASRFEVVDWIWLDLAKYQQDDEHAKEGDERQERVEGLGEGWCSHAVMAKPAASPLSKGIPVDSHDKVNVGNGLMASQYLRIKDVRVDESYL